MNTELKTKFIIGNWKENPEKLEVAKQLLDISLKFQNLAITHAVPNIFVGFLADKKANIILQNISCYEGGSHTGEISALQAKNLGLEMSIVGHSETRLSPQNPKGDEDSQVNLKIKNLFAQNMWALLCIGEFERDENFKSYIQTQIENCLKDISNVEKLMIAYEPVWAIGKDAKRPATNEEIIDTIKFIKDFLNQKFPGNNVKVLYGGSVDENNAHEITNLEHVDGLLIGRASSDPVKWEKLLGNLY